MGGHRAELVEVIRQIRNRWRLKLALRGVVVVVAGSLMALLLSASGLEALKFSAAAIIAFRVIVAVVFATLAALWLWRPLKRQVSDAQVALYLEECDPTLEASLLSAVEASNAEAAGDQTHSHALVDRLVQQAIEKCHEVEYHRTIERKRVRQHMATLAGVAVAAILLVVFGPAFLRNGLSALLIVYRSIEAATPYRIDVTPGTATVPRGSDQQIKAKLFGFKAADAEVRMRSGSDGAWERVPLVPTADPLVFEGILFHLEKPIDYKVISNGVESKMFTMTLVDLPTVSKLELEYRYPAYTGLPPQKIENGGDVAALRGTEVFLHVVPSMNTPSGKILVNDAESRPLTRQADGSLTGSFTIDKQGFYRIELEGPHGEHVTASPQYTIDVTADRAPTVSFLKPGRDTMATAVEELFVEAKASDDFGVKQLELVYAVNGGKEKTVKLFGGAKPLTEVSAGHTIYLEELGLTPGDSVSYYARATDTDSVQAGKTVSSDIYFVQIRPYRKDFKPAQSQAQGGGGGGGGGNDVGQLSQQQKEIVAATFNVIRDKAKISAEKVPRERGVPHLVARQAEDPGRRADREDEEPSGRSGRAVQEDLRPAVEGVAGNGDGGIHAAEAGSEDRDDARAGGAEIPAGGRAGIRDAARPAERRRRWRRRRQRAGQRPRGSVRARARQARESVRDAEAGRRAAGPAEDGRARRQAEGARAAPAAGGRAAAADGGGRTELVGRRRQSAAARGRSGRSGPASGAALARHAAPGRPGSGASAAVGRRRHAARGGQRIARRRRAGAAGARETAPGGRPAHERPDEPDQRQHPGGAAEGRSAGQRAERDRVAGQSSSIRRDRGARRARS